MNGHMEQAAGPMAGDRVRYTPCRAVWNAGRGRSGEEGTLVEILDSAAERSRFVTSSPSSTTS